MSRKRESCFKVRLSVSFGVARWRCGISFLSVLHVCLYEGAVDLTKRRRKFHSLSTAESIGTFGGQVFCVELSYRFSVSPFLFAGEDPGRGSTPDCYP